MPSTTGDIDGVRRARVQVAVAATCSGRGWLHFGAAKSAANPKPLQAFGLRPANALVIDVVVRVAVRLLPCRGLDLRVRSARRHTLGVQIRARTRRRRL